MISNLRQRIATWSDSRAVFANSGWMVADQLARMVLTLAVSVALARSLGPSQFGALKYAMALVALCSSFTNLGLNGIVVRELAREPERAELIMGTTSWLYLMGSLVSASVCVTVGLWRLWDEPLKLGLLLTLAIGVLFHAPRVYEIWFQSQVRSKFTIYARGLPSILSGIGVVVAAALHAPVEVFAVLIVADVIMGAAALTALGVIKRDVPKRLRFDPKQARYLLGESWPVLLSNVAVLIYFKIDQVMIEAMLGQREVGVYAVAVELSEVWYFIPQAIATSAFAGAIVALKTSREAYERRMQDLLDLMIVLAIGIVAFVLLVAAPAVELLYGADYAESAGILRVHIAAAPFIFMGHVLSKAIIAEGFLRFSLVRHVTGALINVVLNLLLIPRFGAYGAAWATLFAYAAAAWVACAIYPRARPMFWLMTRALLYPFHPRRPVVHE